MNPRPFSQLRTHGLLWLVNRVVFHPRGFALAFHYDDIDGEPTGWSLMGDGTRPWTMGDEGPGQPTEDDLFASVEQLLAAAAHRQVPETLDGFIARRFDEELHAGLIGAGPMNLTGLLDLLDEEEQRDG